MRSFRILNSIMLKVLVAIFVLVSNVNAYSKGAPEKRCGDMTPKHHAEPQKSPSPYKIMITPTRINSSMENVTVTLVAPEGRPFKGFLVEARRIDNLEAVGSFDNGSNYQTLDCNGRDNSGITHKNSEEKNQITAIWRPTNFNGKVKFWATFVETGPEFWVNVTTEEVEVSGVELQATVNQMPYKLVYDGCYTTKGCFGGPDDCVKNRNCVHLVTYMATSTSVVFEMVGKTRGWIGIGFSDDANMGGDSVTSCAVDDTNVIVFQSWNPPEGKSNEVLTDYQGLTVLKTSYEDGYIYCQFNHNAQQKINENYIFNLFNQSYYVFLGRGNMDSVSNPVRMARHIQTPYISAVAADLTDPSEIGLASDLLIKLHGSFMIAAWVGTVSIAIFLARYFKQTWPMKKHCGQKIWFTWHRFLNILTLLMNITAFVLIFVHIKGWSSVWEYNPHPILGVIVTALVIIQPIMAAMRCHPGSSKRPIFNWLHFLVGNSAHILAVITLFFAKTLNKAKLPDFYMWILIAFVGFHVAVFLIVEAFTHFHGRKDKVSQIAMKDMPSSNGNSFNVTEVSADVGNRFRKSMLVIYIFGNIAFVVSLIVTVCLSPVKER